MQNEQQPPFQANASQPELNHGGHELFDLHEVLAGTINILDQYMILRQYVQDPTLTDIIDRQYQFIMSQYNVTVDCFTTGQKPSQETATYMMQEDTLITYGIKPSQPKKPNQSLQDVKDSGVTGHMLGLVKSHAGLLAMTSAEVTNPVVRRVLAAQIPNFVELAYEIFLYQNKHGYYQVPQLSLQDMKAMTSSFSAAQGQVQMPPSKADQNRPLH
ncbi:spore coat protein [Bacillus sp. NPDC077027]|uniref:spore coat protein n=1 Tax=Bacillus sp. NPDC077027 TaxID=3390548 RepID=UPI003D00DD43